MLFVPRMIGQSISVFSHVCTHDYEIKVMTKLFVDIVYRNSVKHIGLLGKLS